MTLADQLSAVFASVDADGSLTAIDLASGASVGLRQDVPEALASVAKLPLTWALMTLHHEGALDGRTPLTLRPQDRTRGPVGASQLRDAITLSARDACYYAMALSDNAAADAVWDFIGATRLAQTLGRLQLTALHMRAPVRTSFRLLDEQVAREHLDDATLLTTAPARLAAIDPARVSSGTTRSLAQLLAGIHHRADLGSPPDQDVVGLLSHQLVRNRLASGFPATDVDVRGKTGTMLALHHEAGIVTYPDGHAYAVAILTRSHTLDIHHRLDHAIGEAARTAVQHLRRH